MFIMFLALGLSLFCLYIVCPIALIFQCLNKEKTKLDKTFLWLNIVLLFFVFILTILAIIAFPNAFMKENVIREQIKNEYEILNQEYQPVLDYLDKYKKGNGVYPDKINEDILPKSDTFDKYEYHVGDFLDYKFENKFDKIIIFNAFPHFLDKDALAKKAYELLDDFGYLIIMHDLGKERLNNHHNEKAKDISCGLNNPDEEYKYFSKYFILEKSIDEEDRYLMVLKRA